MNGEQQFYAPDTRGSGLTRSDDTVRKGDDVNAWSVIVDGEAATQSLASLLGGIVEPGAVLLLEGDLGAGKTTFVKGLAQGLGIDPDEVSSPTFTLIHEYEGDMSLYHFDAYRLDDVSEFIELGAEEYFASDGVTAVEWGDRVRDELPSNRLEIAITSGETADGSSRHVTFRPLGDAAQRWVAALRQAWEEAQADYAGARP